MTMTLARYKRFVDGCLRKLRKFAKQNDSVPATLTEEGLMRDFVDYVTTLEGPYAELAEIAKKVVSTHKIEFVRDYEIYDVRFNPKACVVFKNERKAIRAAKKELNRNER